MTGARGGKEFVMRNVSFTCSSVDERWIAEDPQWIAFTSRIRGSITLIEAINSRVTGDDVTLKIRFIYHAGVIDRAGFTRKSHIFRRREMINRYFSLRVILAV